MERRARKKKILTVSAAVAIVAIICIAAVLLLRGEHAQAPKRCENQNQAGTATQGGDVSSGIAFSAESGNYAGGFYLELSVGEGDIYYTLDGSTPTRDSKKYTEKISLVEGDNLLTAVAINEKGIVSEPLFVVYTLDFDVPDIPDDGM